jgi:hypothetical protein
MPFSFGDVLAGPIVRRVEPRLVTVWVALRTPAEVTLRIWDGLEFGDTGTPPLASASSSTFRIGAALHVAVVLIEKPGPAQRLQNDTLYSYDLLLDTFGASSPAGQGLLALGLLKKRKVDDKTVHLPLGYEEKRLPGFCLPPSDVGGLKLLQTSCRLPHSAIYDAMPLMDDLLAKDNAYLDAEKRPQQLFLTGDQIYADDVAPDFLELCNRVGNALLSGDEDRVVDHLPLEHGGETHAIPATTELFPPSRRQRLIHQVAKLTTGSGDSHVLSFGEYCAMYLLGWSSTLWPADFIERRLSERWQRVEDYQPRWKALRAAFDQAKASLDDEDRETAQTKGDYHEAWRFLPPGWRRIDSYLDDDFRDEEWGDEDLDGLTVEDPPDTLADIPTPRPLPHASAVPDEVLSALARQLTPSWFSGQRELGFSTIDHDTEQDNFSQDRQLRQLRGLQEFIEGLPKVRRLLANVPTYMMFDDHEVTDDWNLFQVWVHDVQASPLGRACVRNGLLSYALFQGWGNDPLYFAGRELGEPDVNPTPGTTMLERAMQLYFSTGTEALDGPREDASNHLDFLFNLRNDTATPFSERVRWHFRVGGPGYEVLSLDGRTFRGFKGPETAPELMTLPAIRDQIPADPVYSHGTPPAGEGITFVIAGMPVLGFPPVVYLLQPMINIIDDLKSAPGGPFARAKADYFVGIYDHEPEPWSFNEDIWEALLARLAPYERVVFLSGETHYSVSVQLDYWRYPEDGSPPLPSRFLQFTSSAAKNFAGKGKAAMFRSGFASRLADLLAQPQERAGFETELRGPPLQAPDDEPFTQAVRLRNEGDPAIIPLDGVPAETHRRYQPTWSWRLDLMRDPRPDEARLSGVDVPPLTEPNGDGVGFAHDLARRHFWQSIRSPSRMIAFQSNFGLITVQREAQGLTIDYAVHYVLRETTDTKAKGYSVYSVPLSAAAESPPTLPPLLEPVPP